ncbi:MAG: aquaporin family protein [Actinobacteria bacterium]|nr:aquaporin family protein [Actinomycetota bacterium]
MIAQVSLTRRAFAEFLATALLVAAVVGSGIAAQTLSPNDVGLQLLENTIATAGALFAIIVVFAPISGSHLNPVVTIVDCAIGRRSWSDAIAYIPAQVVGAIVGAIVANVMFDRAAIETSTKVREGSNIYFAELVATFGLVLVIFLLVRTGRAMESVVVVPAAVAGYITAAYWFTSSTSFANPAVTIGRAFSDTFAGIAPASVPPFIVAQTIGAALALGAVIFLTAQAKDEVVSE